jgi:hypothetical protein
MRPGRALVAAAAALAGCGGRNLPGDVTWESEHFVYKTRTGEQTACADILPALEDHFRTMQQAIGFDWPAGAKVTYYKFEDVVDYHANSDCAATADACAPGITVETSEVFNPHELVHTYLHETGFPPPLLLEGAAVALSCASWRRSRPAIPWREAYGLPASGPRAAELYSAGGWLAGYLLATRGTRAFVDFYRDAGYGRPAAEFAATFARIYGESLDDVWAEMIAAGRPPAFCPWECSRPQAPLDGVTPVASGAACGLEPTQAITLAQPSELVATLTGVSNFSLGICGAGSVPPAIFFATSGVASRVDYLLAAGDYFTTGPTAAGTLTLAAHPPGTFIRSASDCTTPATPAPWLDQTGDLTVVVPRGTWHADLSWSSPADVAFYLPPPPSTASLCPSCDAAADACAAPPSTFEPLQGTQTLRVNAAPAAGGPELVEVSLTAL